MDPRTRLFLQRDPYAWDDGHFLAAMREMTAFHLDHCPEYAALARREGFDLNQLEGVQGLACLPALPTTLLKQRPIFSLPPGHWAVRATSSGTGGRKSEVGYDRGSLLLGVGMMVRFFARHGALSLRPVNYLILGYERVPQAGMGAAKSAYGATWAAPALHRAYALRWDGTDFRPDPAGVEAALDRYLRQGAPVRLVGFPAYLYQLVQTLAQRGQRRKLHPKSMVLIGGGWKGTQGRQVEREELLALVEQWLGIPRQRCLEFFSAVEHPLPYCRCVNGNFHIPAYSRVLARDVDDLHPLGWGKPGLLNFISPLVRSMPLLSVVTDDLGTVWPGEGCGCGIGTPYFRLLGRAATGGVRTCAADAAQRLGGGGTE